MESIPIQPNKILSTTIGFGNKASFLNTCGKVIDELSVRTPAD